MRILFTSTPGLGHLHPLLPLMRAAHAAGDEVLVAISPAGEATVRDLGFATAPTAEPPPAEVGAFWSRLADQPDGNTYVVGGFFGGLRLRAAIAPTAAIVADFRPDLVVSECMEFAGQLAAEAAGIPHVTVGIGAMGMAGFTPDLLIANVNRVRADIGVEPVDVVPWRHKTRFVTAVPRLLWGGPDDAPADAIVYRHADAEGAEPASQALARPAAVPTAPAGRARVYATLGSVAGQMAFVARAYPAVLAALGKVDADVLFTIGALDPAELGPIPPNVKVESYVPQEIAMACDAVVIHGGCGTTVAALSRGLPIVFVPLFADQPDNAARVTSAGAGLTVQVPEGLAELPAAVDAVLADPRFRVRARSIAAELATLPSAAEALAEVRLVPVH